MAALKYWVWLTALPGLSNRSRLLLLERYGFKPHGGCALFQWLITEHAPALHEFMARRGILLRIFTHNSSLRFGLPANAAEEARLEQALQAFAKESK